MQLIYFHEYLFTNTYYLNVRGARLAEREGKARLVVGGGRTVQLNGMPKGGGVERGATGARSGHLKLKNDQGAVPRYYQRNALLTKWTNMMSTKERRCAVGVRQGRG